MKQNLPNKKYEINWNKKVIKLSITGFSKISEM